MQGCQDAIVMASNRLRRQYARGVIHMNPRFAEALIDCPNSRAVHENNDNHINVPKTISKTGFGADPSSIELSF